MSSELNARQIFDTIVESRSPSTKPAYFSDVLTSLLWMLDGEKISVASVFEGWLSDCDDSFKVEIVLRNDEIFPFIDIADFQKALERVKTTFPEFTELCNAMEKARGKN